MNNARDANTRSSSYSRFSPLANGLMTGLVLQLAIGPVFFFVLGIAVDSSYGQALCAVAAVTLVDYVYIALATVGLGKALEHQKARRAFSLLSSLVLAFFGVMTIVSGASALASGAGSTRVAWTHLSAFAGAFFLTITSPLTILFWGSVFSAKAVEKGYRKNEMALFAVGAGMATFLFLSLSVLAISLFRAAIPQAVVKALNCLVGLVLVAYAVNRAWKTVREGMSARGQSPRQGR